MSEKRIETLIKLGQFLIGSVVLGTVTTVINYHIQQREVEVKELEQLGKFVEHAIDENVAVRQRFADYFATVSRSEVARERWQIYKVKLDEEQAEIEAEKEALKQEKEAQVAKAEEANESLLAALEQVTELQQKMTSLSSSQAAEKLKSELDAKRSALQAAQQRQLETEQKIANLELRLKDATQQLQYPTKNIQPLTPMKSGWIFLGTYEESRKLWSNTYFNIPPGTPPQKLKGKELEITATAINVRSSMPNTFGRNAPIVDVLKHGSEVNVLEVLPWSETGYIWAQIRY